MCGLVAMHTTEKGGFLGYDRDELKQMLLLNSIRGSHSTGLAGVNARMGGEVALVKSVGSPYNLFSYNETTDFFNQMLARFTTIIGHGRYATHGAITALNAHPFTEGHITLAHNGVIKNFYTLKDFTKHKDIDVDSHLIARLFAEEGAENVLPKIEGAYVFIWYDREKQTFNVARNKERPLYVAKQDKKDILTFASEEETLIWNSQRNQTAYESISEIPVHQIWTYHNDSITPVITEYEPIVHKPPVYAVHKPQQKQFKDYQNASIRVDGECSFVIDDYVVQQNGYISIVGSSKMYPNVLFRAALPADRETDIYNADFVEGTVLNIYTARPTDVGFAWQVFVGDVSLFLDDPVDDAKVDIQNVLGHIETIYKFRLVAMSAKGCSWCSSELTADDLKDPTKLLLWDETPTEQGVVCPSCAKGTIGTFH